MRDRERERYKYEILEGKIERQILFLFVFLAVPKHFLFLFWLKNLQLSITHLSHLHSPPLFLLYYITQSDPNIVDQGRRTEEPAPLISSNNPPEPTTGMASLLYGKKNNDHSTSSSAVPLQTSDNAIDSTSKRKRRPAGTPGS